VDIRDIYNRLKHEVAKFGTIGLIAFVIDVGIFNLLLQGPLSAHPVTAGTISGATATAFAYIGNRFWTFQDRARTSYSREFFLFVVLNIIGLGIQLSCLAISHYGFGWTSPLADNISKNGFGLIFGTLFRFWSYRKWVFLESPDDTKADSSAVQL
jgi:putative flippase GtrA